MLTVETHSYLQFHNLSNIEDKEEGKAYKNVDSINHKAGNNSNKNPETCQICQWTMFSRDFVFSELG